MEILQNEYEQLRKLDVIILNEGEKVPHSKLKLKKVIPEMKLIDINKEEEDRDRIHV